MPLRRSSATASPSPAPPPFSTPPPSTRSREHSNLDSWSISDFSIATAQPGMAVSGEAKIVSTLVGRLVNKLPCNTGTRLSIMEVDPAIRHTVDSLLGLVKIRPTLVFQSLGSALETLSKYSASSANETPLDNLHSQLFLLNILLRCLSAAWTSHAERQSVPPGDFPRPFPDLPQMDEALGRYLLAVTLVYVRLISTELSTPNGTSSPAPSRETRLGTASTSSSSIGTSPASGSNPIGIKFIQQHSFPSGSTSIPPSSALINLSGQCQNTERTVRRMEKTLSRIVFILSSANWSLILSRLKSRISHLTTTIEDAPDFVDLRLLEWSNLNRSRLSQVLQEISSTFLHVKRPAQITIAIVLRRAIWTWIDVNPAELDALIESNRRIEGGADVLFDVLHSASDPTSSSHAKRTKAFYPLMTMLLVTCPDMLKRASLGEPAGRGLGGLTKKLSFLESLRKGVNSSKGFEACTICYVDLVRAAMSVSPRLESAGVRSITHDIQSDLRNALFHSPHSTAINDPDLLVDGLIALYRANPVTTAGLLFGKILAETNEANRLAAIRACRVIQLEDGRLPWHTPSSELRDKVAAGIRQLFKACAVEIMGDLEAIHRPRTSPSLPSTQNDLVIEILELYQDDPKYAMIRPTDTWSNLLTTTSSLVVGPSPGAVRASASRCNIRLIQAICDEDDANLFGRGDAIWQLLIDVSRQGLHVIHFSHDDIIPAFQAFRDTAVAIAQLAERQSDILASSTRGEAAVLLAMVAIVTVLVSPDFEQLGQSIPALRAMKTITLIAHKMYLPGVSPAGTNFGTPEARVIARTAFFDAISSLPPAQGRQQQQRQFRKVYRIFSKPHTGGIAMWLGLHSQVKALTSLIIAADADSTVRNHSRRGLALDIDGLDEDQAKTWQNAVLYLAATAAVCQYDVVPPPSFADSIGRGILPRLYEEFPDSMLACDDFVRECVGLLSSGSVHVRETVKEALGSELPASLGRVMISQMTNLLGHSVGPNGISTSDTYTTFVDQVLTVLRLFIDRVAASEQDGVHLDIKDLVSLLLQYITRLGRDEYQLRIKIKFCQTIGTILDNRTEVIMLNSGTLRNQILETLVDWTVEAQRDRDYLPSSATADSGLRVLQEIDIATLKAIVPATESLVLKASSDDLETSSVAVRTRLFYRYYTHLTKILERNQASANDTAVPTVNLSPEKPSGCEDASALAVSSLSNLLSANLDVGLKHCLSLGYHEHPTLRTAFMRLLTNVLQQGARFNSLLTKRLSASPKPFTDLLIRDPENLALAVSICEICSPSEIDEISSLLFRTLEAKGLIVSLVKVLAEREIALTNHESELFRGNSITTRILTIFARTYGYNYVRATLQPLVYSLVEKPAECSFELDPSKAGPNDDIEQNADRLQLMCQALLDMICASTSRVPIVFRALCHHLWEATTDRYPDARHSVVGSFIFLRFFCPSIVAPENIDLEIAPDTREIRRALLLITKVIQNLANNVTFGNKEPHMKVLDGFLSENIRQVSKFLSDLGVKPKANEVADAVKRYQEDAEKVQDADGDETILSRFIAKHRSKLETSLESLPATFRYGPGGAKLDRQDFQTVPVLATLRQLMEKASVSNGGVKGLSASARSQAYDEFMRHNAGRDVENVSSAFYEGPTSQKNGRRIFYFIVSRVGLVDYDLLAYRVFSVLENTTDFFDLVIDLTDFSAANELPMAWLKRSIQMCPPSILPCINVLALYNPNSYAKRRIRWISSELLTVVSPAGKQIIAASTPEELSTVIPWSSPALPEYTLALAYQSDHVFTNLLCLSDHEHQIPVVVRLGHDCLQIASWRKQDLVSTVKSYIIDLIKLRDIDDVITGGSLPDKHIMIKYGQNETMTFISGKRSEIAQIIRAARAKLREGPSEERTLRPSDVPGTLLNVALMNLSSGDEGLRRSAYNLIHEMSGYFKWDMALSVLRVTTGLHIPNNAIAFTQSVSSALAQSAPHLTLEFLKEWTIGFSKSEISQRCAALNCVGPWLDQLDLFSRPTRERTDMAVSVKSVEEIIRALVTITLAERRRLHLAIQEHVWSRLARSHESLVDIITLELVHVAIDAGFGSEKSESVADILVSMGCTAVRGRVIARLRKTIVKTHIDDSPTLIDNIAWLEIATLSRMVLALSFNPTVALEAQLFLPDLCHIITLLTCSGPTLMRETVYGLAVNTVQALAASRASGDMDTLVLQRLLDKLQTKEVVGYFGLVTNGDSFELLKPEDDTWLGNIEMITQLLGDVLIAGAVSFDCANAWRARWMSLVVSTCFQHSPAIQPQAYTVLGYLAADEVDDDLAYQVLGTMGNTLADLGETDDVLIIATLRCFCRIVPGLQPKSRYHANLFWVAIAILQLGYIPLFAAALELLLVCLRAMAFEQPLVDTLLAARSLAGDPARKLDQIARVSFETDPGFSFVGVLYKGVRHPSTRKLAVECMLELLRMIVRTTKHVVPVVEGKTRGIGGRGTLVEDGIGLFVALLPLSSPDSQETTALIELVGGGTAEKGERSVMDYLTISDASTAMLIITLVTTILQTASSETERVVLYNFLAEASIEMPEVVAMSYDSLIPRMISVLPTTTNIPILDAVTSILERAMLEPTYTFPNGAGLPASESMGSLQHRPSNSFGHGKHNAGSISSFSPSVHNAARDQALDDLGLRSLAELSFVPVKWERVSMGAKWIAALIDHLVV